MTEDPIPEIVKAFRASAGEAIYEGYVKLKLVHARGFSVLIPDLILADLDGWSWFQAQFFSACSLSFFEDAGYAEFNVEPIAGVKLMIAITRDRLVRSYVDGSFLYRCLIAGPQKLKDVIAGTCSVDENHTIWLDLFHHTTAEAASAIRRDGHFRGSRWNIQGNKQLANVEYVYFTNLLEVTSREHLERIAMASDGALYLITTNGAPPRDIVRIEVYRESTLNRTHAIHVRVPAEALASGHVWRHDAFDQPTYYEISHPAIFRVGLEPRTVLPFTADALDITRANPRRFDYVVLGYATSKAGLLAPYDEEDTREIFTIERCEATGDLFSFWRIHSNQDHYKGRAVDRQRFEK